MKITDRLDGIRQRHHVNRLRKAAIHDYLDDPDVVFHDTAPERTVAPHGSNTPEEMTLSAEPVEP